MSSKRVSNKRLATALVKHDGIIGKAIATELGLSKQTIWSRVQADPKLLAIVEDAKSYVTTAAKSVVVAAIVEGEDVATAKWWLERQDRKNFGNSTSVRLGDAEIDAFLKSLPPEAIRALAGGAD